VQPPKGYAREDLKPYDAFSPLNRLVDAVPPESNHAREFNDLCARIASGKAAPKDLETARQQLTLWRDNDALLAPTLPKSDLTAELLPLSKGLSRAATIGLLALDALQSRRPLPAATRKQQLAELQLLMKPQAVLLDRIVPGVEMLVQVDRTK
jgi:hexosaminidase